MTLLLTNRKDPSKLKAFIVQKGGVFETSWRFSNVVICGKQS